GAKLKRREVKEKKESEKLIIGERFQCCVETQWGGSEKRRPEPYTHTHTHTRTHTHTHTHTHTTLSTHAFLITTHTHTHTHTQFSMHAFVITSHSHVVKPS